MQTCRNSRKSLSIFPVPSTTEASGSSAIDTGNPVSSRMRLSKFFSSAPPPHGSPIENCACGVRRAQYGAVRSPRACDAMPHSYSRGPELRPQTTPRLALKAIRFRWPRRESNAPVGRAGFESRAAGLEPQWRPRTESEIDGATEWTRALLPQPRIAGLRLLLNLSADRL